MTKQTDAMPVANTQQLNADAVREAIASIRLALGGHTPALLTEKQVEAIGLRSAVSLRRDRCWGNNSLPFVRGTKGEVRYRLADIIEAIAGMRLCVDMPEARREKLTKNLARAHELRAAAKAGG